MTHPGAIGTCRGPSDSRLCNRPHSHPGKPALTGSLQRLAQRLPFFYGWVILASASSTQVVRNASASLTLAVFIYPLADDPELGWSRTLIAGAASVGGLAASALSPLVGWLVDRYGARLVLASSVFIMGLATILLSLATIPIFFYPLLRHQPCDFRQSHSHRRLRGGIPVVCSNAGPDQRYIVCLPFHRTGSLPADCLSRLLPAMVGRKPWVVLGRAGVDHRPHSGDLFHRATTRGPGPASRWRP